MTAPHAPSLTILTGASRGMGLAMARQLLVAGNTLLCISRTSAPSLADDAARTGTTLMQWEQDLADGAAASHRLAQWLQQNASPASGVWGSAVLINNAGVIPRIAPLSDAEPTDLARALRVGLEAPMQLAAAFVHATAAWQVPRKVLNISSGLGRRAMASQAAYCAAKAGLDHFSRCLALEEALKPNGARVCALAPGVIDTDMQVQLRAADSAAFPDRGSFVQLKKSGSLTSPEDAAARVLAYLASPRFGSEPVADVRG
ncbi:MAG: short-chain dehydrogenase [Polaromonas sp.]|nr:short-chain dehydrogenase [Polaromonas sp.]